MSDHLLLEQAMPGIQGLQPYQPGKPVEELERELGITHSLKLASNENPLGPSPEALSILMAQLEKLHLYPDGNGFALKQALSAKLNVAPECLTLGNGSNDVLDLIARAYLGPGRNAVFSQYAFAVYPISTLAAGAQTNIVSANPSDHAMPCGHDLVAMRAAINDQTHAIFIANPNNPTGTWLQADALEDFISSVPEHIIVVVDEAYIEYVSEEEFPDALQWLGKYPNLVITRTFSKIYGLAGLRVGYAISHPEVADVLNRVRQPFNVNSLALAAAEAALTDDTHVEQSRAMNLAGLIQLAAGLDDLGLSYLPSVGNFICADIGRASAPVYNALLHEGVIVRPVANYGLPNHLRITVSREEDNLRVLSALGKVLA
jgi:histidinol-phosphate aminotransferase